jgi:Asp/Glu/hydantoin racemase
MLAFLHTSPAHVDTFDTLLRRRKPGLSSRHYVEAEILPQAKEAGVVTPGMWASVERAVREAERDGADVLLCTCSTIGPLVESLSGSVRCDLLRVDRPIARKAVGIGSRIALVATLRSTLPATRELLREEAARAGRGITIEERVCESAWPLFEAGDRQGYLREIARSVGEVEGRADVIVLAQASMMGVEDFCADSPVPILSSPEIGLDAALALYEGRAGGEPRGGAGG